MKFKKISAVVSALCMMCVLVPFFEETKNTSVISARADERYEHFTYFVNYDDSIMITGYDSDLAGDLIIPDEINGMPVTSIEKYAFEYCKISSVVIPDSVTEIGVEAFGYCTGLISVTLPNNIKTISSDLFYYCSSLTSVNIPDTVVTIEGYAFMGCNSLTSIDIPEGVTEIGYDSAFRESGLKSVVIPKTVTRIERDTFKDCNNLASVTILNPNCYIDDGSYDTLGITSRTVIRGYEGSTAQEKAKQMGFKFVPLEEEAPAFLFGDVDNSGKIDILDVITINKAILGKEKLTDEQLKAVDFNGDGKPDASDSLKLMKFIVGLITSFTE